MKLLIQHPHKNTTQISGVLTYIRLIVPMLEKKGIHIRIVSTEESAFKQWLKNILWADVIFMNSNDLRFALCCKLLGKKIILMIHYLFYQSLHVHCVPMTFRKRFITEIKYLKKNWSWSFYAFLTCVGRLISRLLTAFIANYRVANSSFLANSISFPLKINVLHLPIPVIENKKTKTINDISHPYTFLFVGRLDKDKGADILIKATHVLVKNGEPFKINILGDGKESENLKHLVLELGISDYITFYGTVSHNTVLASLSMALTLVVPSRWQEPAGYIVLEASSVQTCSIVSKMGGLPEMTGPSALFFENEDINGLAHIMSHCLRNPEETLQRGAQACCYAKQRFNAEIIANQLISICNKL